MAVPELIYCADGNPRFMQIARDNKFLPGAQLPRKIYDAHLPLYFSDQNFKRPQYIRYIKALRKYQPVMASVLDIMEWRRWDEYLMRAGEISQYVQIVMVIPKINGVIKKLADVFEDKKINGREIRLGYSIKTKYGGTDVPTKEFAGWPVHLLGGSPVEQLAKSKEMNVASCDGNYAQLMSGYCQFFYPEFLWTEEYIDRVFYQEVDEHGKRIKKKGKDREIKNPIWPTLLEFHKKKWGDGTDKADAPYEAFSRSCQNIMAMWQT